MKMAIVPRYADIFDEPVPQLQDLLKDISSEVIIGLLSMIQAKLDLDLLRFLQIRLFRTARPQNGADYEPQSTYSHSYPSNLFFLFL